MKKRSNKSINQQNLQQYMILTIVITNIYIKNLQGKNKDPQTYDAIVNLLESTA